MNSDEVKNNIILFTREHNLRLHPQRPMEEHLASLEKKGRCPCRRDRPQCPCLESLTDIKDVGRCACNFLLSQEYYISITDDIAKAKQKLMTFISANNLRINPKRSLEQHLDLYIRRGHCPCRNERPQCPCPESLLDISQKGKCACWILCSEEYYNKLVKGIVKY